MEKAMRLVTVITLAFVITGPLGCDPAQELTAEELATRTTKLSSDTTRQLVEAIRTLEEFGSLEVFGHGLEVLADVWGVSGESGEGGGTAPDPAPPIPPGGGDSGGWDLDAEETAQAVDEFLHACVLVPEHLESEEPDRAVYLLPGALVCSDDCFGDDGDDACDWPCDPGDVQCEQEKTRCQERQTEDLEACAATIDDVEVRVELRTDGDGVAIRLLLGPGMNELVMVGLHDDRVSMAIDLAELKDALVHLLSVLGEQDWELPEVMEGQLALVLERHGEKDFSLRSEIARDVRVKMVIPDEGTLEVTAAKAEPATRLRIRGTEKILEAAVDLNQVMVSLPFTAVAEGAAGELIVEIGGLEAATEIGAADEIFSITGIGLGETTSRIRHGQTDILTVDLNPDHGRHLDLSVAAQGDMPLFSFEPGVGVVAYTNLCHLDAWLAEGEEPVPAELCDQTYELGFFDEGGPAKLMPVEGDGLRDAAIRVVAGTLRLSSSAVADALVIEEGQCAAPLDPCEPVEHGALECVAVYDCQ